MNKIKINILRSLPKTTTLVIFLVKKLSFYDCI